MAVSCGIDVGPSAIRGVVVEWSGKQLKLLAASDIPCETSQTEALTLALTQLRRALRITTPVVLGLPSTSVILTTASPLAPNPRRAGLAVQFELQQNLPFDLHEAVWHHQWLSPVVTGNGRAQRFSLQGSAARSKPSPPLPQRSPLAVVAAMRRSLLDERLACCRRAGLMVRAVAVNPIALLNVCAMNAAPGRLSLHPGGSGSPGGAAGRRAGAGEARAARHEEGDGLSAFHLVDEAAGEWIVATPTAFHAIPVPRGDDAAPWQELASAYEAFRAQGLEIPAPVWLVVPPEAALPLEGIFSAQLGLPVKPVDLTQWGSAGSVRLRARATAALGLTLQGLGLARIAVNLLSMRQEEAKVSRAHRLATIASGLLALAIVGFGLRGMLEVRHRRLAVLRGLEAQERLYQSLRPEIRALLQRQEHVEQRSLQLERLVSESSLVTQLLAQTAEALPDTVWLTKADYTKGSSALLDGFLEGHAKSFQDVTQLMDQLKTVAGMTTVKPLSTNVINDETTGKELIAFTIQIQRPSHPEDVPRDAPVAPPSKKRQRAHAP